MITTEIPVKNYFFLLSYAWNMMHESSQLKVNFEKCNTPSDLFASILVNGLNVLIRKGLKKDYKPLIEPVGYIRGKILISDSVTYFLSQKGKLICEHDELTHNNLENQIIFQTLRNLRSSKIDSSLKKEIHKLLRLSEDIRPIEVQKSHFKNRPRHKDPLLSLLLNVCEVAYLSSLPTYISGDKIFRDFVNDENSLGSLFEAFIYNFYRSKLKNQFSISKDHIRWGLTAMDEASENYLPRMRTDVVVQSERVKIIIDTKFYKSTFQNFHDKETIHSGNLYQIQSYIVHDSSNGEKKDRVGVLLYPTIKKTPPLKYKYPDGNGLQVRTIDLSKDWYEIEKDLLDMIVEIAA